MGSWLQTTRHPRDASTNTLTLTFTHMMCATCEDRSTQSPRAKYFLRPASSFPSQCCQISHPILQHWSQYSAAKKNLFLWPSQRSTHSCRGKRRVSECCRVTKLSKNSIDGGRASLTQRQDIQTTGVMNVCVCVFLKLETH